MELYHLKTFATVAEEGHLTRAADRLHTSQPAISAHIKALEEELGVTLFNRTPKGMQLTAEGEQLLPRAQQTLTLAGDFKQLAKSLQDELIGSIRIGLNSDAEHLRLPLIQQALGARYPRLEQHFMAGMTQTNIPNVRIGRLDAAFISGSCNDPKMRVIPLANISLHIAAPLAWRDQLEDVSIRHLAELPWIYTDPNCAYFSVMHALFEQHSCYPQKIAVSDQEEALYAMVKAGVGLGIIRGDEAERGQAEGHFHVLPVTLPSVELSFIYPKKRANDPIIRAFVEVLAEVWEVDPLSTQQQKAG